MHVKNTIPACSYIGSFSHKGFKISGNKIFLPKIGGIRFYKSRKIEGTPKNITVSRKGQHWFVSIQCEVDVFLSPRLITDAIGIDMGAKRFLAKSTSETDYVEPLNSFKKLEYKLVRAQKLLARKIKFSNNWKKQKQVITKLHIKIADARNDFLQKQSTILSKNHAMIVSEDLKIKYMSTSAKGTIEKPGKKVKIKAGLNKTILDKGWGMFLRMLEYKQEWSGGIFLQVDPKNTSRTCPVCGYISADNRKTQTNFKCMECDYKANADYVAAVNIRERGLKEYGGGIHRDSLWKDGISRLLKQEPVGTSNQVPILTPA